MIGRLLAFAISILRRVQKAMTDDLYSGYRKKYNLAPSFKFNGDGILLYGEGRIEVGEKTYIGRGSSLQSVPECKISIGSFCAISHYVKIYTSSYMVDQDFCTMDRKVKSGDVIIGNGVWIGANVLINPGVRIGDNAVIGANSVVTKNVQANSVVAGIPAVFVRLKKY